MAGPPGARRVLAGEGGRSDQDQSADLHHWRMARHLPGSHALGLCAPQMPKETLDGTLDAYAARAGTSRTARLPARDEALVRSLVTGREKRHRGRAPGAYQRATRKSLETRT